MTLCLAPHRQNTVSAEAFVFRRIGYIPRVRMRLRIGMHGQVLLPNWLTVKYFFVVGEDLFLQEQGGCLGMGWCRSDPIEKVAFG